MLAHDAVASISQHAHGVGHCRHTSDEADQQREISGVVAEQQGLDGRLAATQEDHRQRNDSDHGDHDQCPLEIPAPPVGNVASQSPANADYTRRYHGIVDDQGGQQPDPDPDQAPGRDLGEQPEDAEGSEQQAGRRQR